MYLFGDDFGKVGVGGGVGVDYLVVDCVCEDVME